MKIRTAVLDYQKQFPKDYSLLVQYVDHQRKNLKDDMAEIEGTHAIRRALFTISEKLSTMIALKLTEQEALEFREKENQRWFAKEFPQFSLTKV